MNETMTAFRPEHEALRVALIDTMRSSPLGRKPDECSGILTVVLSQLYQRLHPTSSPEQIADAIWDGVMFQLTHVAMVTKES